MLNFRSQFLIAFEVGVIRKCCVFQIFFTHNEEEEIENRTKLADNLKTALRTQSMRWVLETLFTLSSDPSFHTSSYLFPHPSFLSFS